MSARKSQPRKAVSNNRITQPRSSGGVIRGIPSSPTPGPIRTIPSSGGDDDKKRIKELEKQLNDEKTAHKDTANKLTAANNEISTKKTEIKNLTKERDNLSKELDNLRETEEERLSQLETAIAQAEGGTLSDTDEYEENFAAPIEDVLISVGQAIGEAQHRLNLASLESQKEIDQNEELRNVGMQATWYTMPETDLNLKIAMSVSKTSESKGGLTGSKLSISTIDAKYQNNYNFSKDLTSELKVKILPIPKPARSVRIVPDVVDMSLTDGLSVFYATKFDPQVLQKIPVGEIVDESKTKIISIIPEPGTEINPQTPVKIKYTAVAKESEK